MSNNNPTTSSASTGEPIGSTSASRPQAASNTNLATGVATMTMTETETPPQNNEEILELTLRPRPNVRWDEAVIDNEGLGRKSSKRCCIFHKQRDFGESSTDSDGSSSSGGPDGDENEDSKRIARKKPGTLKKKKVADYQRHHA